MLLKDIKLIVQIKMEKKFKYTRCSKEGIPQWDFKKENWFFNFYFQLN